MKRGAGGSEAERLAELWLAHDQGYMVHRVSRPAFVQTKAGGFMRSYDLFGCFDAIAYKGDHVWLVQVTTSTGLVARRRKIEALNERAPLPAPWRVSLFTHETRPSLANRARTENAWRVEDYAPKRVGESVLFYREWLKPFAWTFDRKAVEAKARAARVAGKVGE